MKLDHWDIKSINNSLYEIKCVFKNIEKYADKEYEIPNSIANEIKSLKDGLSLLEYWMEVEFENV